MDPNQQTYQHLFNLDAEPISEVLSKLNLRSNAFKESTVFLTGGARGIGKEAALGLGLLGANVVIVDIRKSGAKVASEIVSKGGNALFIHADISDSVKLVDAYHQAYQQYGTINIVINNAVHFSIASFMETSVEEWDLHQRTNIGAMVHTCKLALPEMIKSRRGVIMNMVGPEGMAYASPMSSSKVAMRSLLYSLSHEIPKDSGVTILGFAPGLVATELVQDVFVKYCNRLNVDFEHYVKDIADNPGYTGMMPVSHCAGGLIYTLANASEFHGLIADAYVPLNKYGIISVRHDHPKDMINNIDSLHTLNNYISEISDLNEKIESRIEERTRQIKKEKEIVVELLKEIQSKNQELESIKDELLFAKDRAEEASTHKEEFLTNVTHEIRTPLNAIIGFVDLLKDSNLTDEQQEHINAIQISGGKLLRLINEVLDISKIESGKLELEPEIFDLHQFLVDLEKSALARAAQSGDKLSLNIDQQVPTLVKGDPNRLHQILINLVGNAIKFTENGTIHLKVSKSEATDEQVKVLFSVKDDGIGIPTENLKTIFDTFTQVKGKRNRKHGGSGVGLSIVKQLVHLHGGTISVNSALGSGSEFVVEIPFEKVSEKELPKKEQITIASNALEGLHILLAEDNKFNQLLEIKILENLGAEVSLAENGREAIELIKKGSFDLILMDIQMPEMDGLDATKFIRNEMKLDIPIIALTANAFRRDLEQYLQVGMNNCVTKPFKKEVLVQRILEHTTNLVKVDK